MADLNKQLSDLKKQLKDAEKAKFDPQKGGYALPGSNKVLSRVELEDLKRELRETSIPQLEAGIRAGKAGVTSATPSGPIVPERVKRSQIVSKINTLTQGEDTFDNVYQLAVAYRQLVDVIDQGFVDPETKKRTQWSDREWALEDASNKLKNVTDSLGRMTVAGGTWRAVVSGKGAAATRRNVLDQTPEQAEETARREKIYADFVQGKMPTVAPTTMAATAPAKPVAGGSTAGQFRMAEEAAGPGPDVTPVSPPTGAGGGKGGKGGKRIKGGTGATTPGGGGAGGGGTMEPEVSSVEWLKDAYAEYGWIASLYESDDSIRTLLDWSKKNIDPSTTDGQQRFINELYKTSWWNNTAESMRNYTKNKLSPEWANTLADKTDYIKGRATAKNLSLSDNTYSFLADEALKYGWTDIEADKAIGAEFVKEATAAEARGSLTPQTDIRTTTQYAKAKKLTGDLMLDNVTDEELSDYTKRIISGDITEDGFKRDMKARAKMRYGVFGDYIDQDYNLRTLTADYRQMAAQYLEKPEGEINFTDSKYAKAFAYDPEGTGKPRQMNLNEWERYIRSLPEWQTTDNAKREYTDVGLSILRMFGKVQ